MKDKKQTTRRLQERRGASPTLSSSGCAQADGATALKPSRPSEERKPNAERGRMSVVHSVFVVGTDGKPLVPTTPARARKLLKGGQAHKHWSKFGTFGIRMIVETRKETPETSFGLDFGTKFEGYAVVCGNENVLAVKLDLPNKKHIVRKMKERRALRRARRSRNCRRRKARFMNRSQPDGWLAPSQAVIVNSRIKIITEFLRCYPVSSVGLEDVRFNHAKYCWGRNFSTVEIGKARIRNLFKSRSLRLFEFAGYQTRDLRLQYGYKKSSSKSADRFDAHCTDALALACEAGPGKRIESGRFIVVDDTYRSVRRRLHDTQFASGGVRANYSCGTVFGIQKGVMIGAANGKIGQLCGEMNGKFRYYDKRKKRQATRRLMWISRSFNVRGGQASTAA